MADIIISIVANRVAAIIEDEIRYQVNLVRGVEEELLDLSEKLNTIKTVLEDAEKRGVKDESVKNWLKKLEDTAYDVDGILDEWNYALLKHKMAGDAALASAEQKVCCSHTPSSCLCFNKVVARRDTAKKIQNVKAKLDEILREKDDFNFVMHLPSIDHMPKSGRVQTTSSIELEKVIGEDIERNKNDIQRKLMLNGDSQILSIVGMGGIGKSTLAQLVFNDIQTQVMEDGFELRIWICVSDPFDVAAIARGIVESVGIETIPPNTNQLELVLQKLRDCISDKKFLLVLDDVWTQDYNKWEPLKINLKYGAPGSKILVTTRNERVAKMMGTFDDDIYRPQELSDEECWSLMRRIFLSGRSEEECRDFEDVGKKIAKKCKGLPLAANVLGSLLQFKTNLEEWENILESEIWQLKEAELELFPHLLLSYNELSPALKRCFSYCAVYPKDSKINVESMIEQWMALGYLGSVTGNTVELTGRDHFNNLAMRCLFQDFEKSGELGEHVEWCKMHDIVHDFAQFLMKKNERAEMRKRCCQVCDPFLVSQVKGNRSLSWDKRTPRDLCDCLTSVRVFRSNEVLHRPPPQGMKKLIQLRWLDLSHGILSQEDLKSLCKLYFLQTLLLADCWLEEITAEIENLVHLRHLDLSDNKRLKELPESMCSLPELQILNIEGCKDLYRLPEEIHRLQNLQHLLIKVIPASYCFPEGVGQLRGIRTLKLDWFHGGSVYNNKLGLLKNLNRLTGSLKLNIHFTSMSDLEELVADAGEAELRNKIHIHTLHFHFEDDMDESERSSSSAAAASPLWLEVIEALEPYHKLNLLKIWGYKGSRLPHWMSSPLNLVKQIYLFGFNEVRSLPPMGKLPFLEVLYLKRMKELKVVGREFLGIESSSSSSTSGHVVAFPQLKRLEFYNCHEWEEWEDITAEDEESADVSVMPCLTRLCINWCEALKKLPHRLLRKASSLRFLNHYQSSELVKRYSDKEGSAWRSLSQYNPKLRISSLV
ncbi:putative disease resistance protein RGA4 [Salvia miltiorrhiza]|uniref:putative disease resistance protein RGA4 n=1 Tax=Salvia miltiorrhiza TaxID=226208 RepID=UPI0025AD5183|nr:putative disease resistance protein RGA4 [Salvia miltiorrhiza]